MPRVIETATPHRAELGDLVETLESGRFDARDEDCFASFGDGLKALANNRDFLADMLVDELKQRCRDQSARNVYGPQVVILHQARDFFIRANFWPSEDDRLLQENGHEAFFYHVPHDHNFSFLTAGYMGPGYWSDYYEYDYDNFAGAIGDEVDLRFVERSRLEQGKIMLYRAHRDVHAQLPADELSVSLNIMERAPHLSFRDQYRFDVEGKTVAAHLTRSAVEPLLALCAQLGGGDGRNLVESFAAHHPSDRIQFSAITALASAQASLEDRLAVFERGARDANPFIARMAARQCAAVERGRPWIQRSFH
ncbi:transposase [Sphingomonas sp. DG1-23]|uniref:transposase n=1 Tax=Sphingomonas sp. DG1-23 TaxID=3068316 RepID=UPI00273EE7AE|nr:transposase [Sphingomonas sp. DG1-23]MDP5279888.1 transposase [Sphingomonas sp. DG1-23]